MTTRLEDTNGFQGGIHTGVAIFGFLLCFLAGGGVMWGYARHAHGASVPTEESSPPVARATAERTPSTAAAKVAAPPAPAPTPAAPPLERKAIALDPRSPAIGGADAKVVIQEFSDFQCPACFRAEPTMKELRQIYGDKIRIVWRDMPLAMHPEAPVAAEAAREAYAQKGAAGFWAMHDKLFANQRDFSRAKIDTLAGELGLDVPKFKQALDAGKHQPMIENDADIAAKAGIDATPAFLINGYFVSGARPLATFRAVIDRALAEAK